MCGTEDFSHHRVSPALLARYGYYETPRNREVFRQRPLKSFKVLIVDGESIVELHGAFDSWSTPGDLLNSLKLEEPNLERRLNMSTYFEGDLLLLKNRAIHTSGHPVQNRFLLTDGEITNIQSGDTVLFETRRIGSSSCPGREAMGQLGPTFNAEPLCSQCWNQCSIDEQFSIV